MNNVSDGTPARYRRNPIPAAMLALFSRRHRPRVQVTPRQEIRTIPGAFPGTAHSLHPARRAVARLLLLSAALCACMGCAVATKKLPIREIDRPLNDPAGIKRISLTYNMGSGIPGGLIPTPNISYAVTDRVSFPRFPLPVLQYRFYGENMVSGDTIKAPALSIALVAGTVFSYSSISPIVGMIGKKKLSRSSWLSVEAAGRFAHREFVEFNVDPYIGIQAGNRNCFWAGTWVNASYFIGDSNSVFHKDAIDFGRFWLYCGVPIGWKVHLFPWWSADVTFLPIVYSNGITLTMKQYRIKLDNTFAW